MLILPYLFASHYFSFVFINATLITTYLLALSNVIFLCSSLSHLPNHHFRSGHFTLSLNYPATMILSTVRLFSYKLNLTYFI